LKSLFKPFLYAFIRGHDSLKKELLLHWQLSMSLTAGAVCPAISEFDFFLVVNINKAAAASSQSTSKRPMKADRRNIKHRGLDYE